jgi:hypothetical protein
MRKLRTSGIAVMRRSCPALAAAWIGESGGTYQTIGRVRYSGCSGKATFHSIAIFQTGRMARGFEPGLRHAVRARLRDHRRIVGVEEDVELRLVEVFSSGTLAASSIRSAS